MSQLGKFFTLNGQLLTLTGDTGGAVSPTAFNINIVGNAPLTVSGNPGTSTLTIEGDGTLVTQFDGDVGSATPAAGILNIIGGSNINTSAAGNTITINGSGVGVPWSEETTTPVTMVSNNGYIANDTSLITLTLPTTAAIGDVIRVTGEGSGGWRIAQPAGVTIFFGNQNTTTGVGGYLEFTHRRDTVELVCVTANLDWNVISSIGNITVV